MIIGEKMKRNFGRIPSPFDARDYNLRDYMPVYALAEPPREQTWEFPAEPLDQMETQHCVGFSMAGFGINLPIYTPYTNEDGHEFYYMCKILEGEPTAELGCFIRSAAIVLKNLGLIDAYAFAPDVPSLLWWIVNRSPLMVGTVWTDEMNTPNSSNIISIGGRQLGGHAYLINEVKGDYIRIQNSWGAEWGDNGKAYISITNFEKLFAAGGEAITTVELKTEPELIPEIEPETIPEIEPEPTPVLPQEEPSGCCPMAKLLSKLFRK